MKIKQNRVVKKLKITFININIANKAIQNINTC